MSIPNQDGSVPREGDARTEGNPKAPGPALNSPKTEEGQTKRPAEALSPEEQMALYEKELKENDWGHQPC